MPRTTTKKAAGGSRGRKTGAKLDDKASTGSSSSVMTTGRRKRGRKSTEVSVHDVVNSGLAQHMADAISGGAKGKLKDPRDEGGADIIVVDGDGSGSRSVRRSTRSATRRRMNSTEVIRLDQDDGPDGGEHEETVSKSRSKGNVKAKSKDKTGGSAPDTRASRARGVAGARYTSEEVESPAHKSPRRTRSQTKSDAEGSPRSGAQLEASRATANLVRMWTRKRSLDGSESSAKRSAVGAGDRPARWVSGKEDQYKSVLERVEKAEKKRDSGVSGGGGGGGGGGGSPAGKRGARRSDGSTQGRVSEAAGKRGEDSTERGERGGDSTHGSTADSSKTSQKPNEGGSKPSGGSAHEEEEVIRLGAAPVLPQATTDTKSTSATTPTGSSQGRRMEAWRGVRAAGFTSVPQRSGLLRLHEEILDFAELVTPTVAENHLADDALETVKSVILELYPSAKIHVFGSRVTGLMLPESDWDLVVMGVPGGTSIMWTIGQRLRSRKVVSYLEVIAKARVPVIKLVEAKSGIHMDISFNLMSGVVSSQYIRSKVSTYPMIRPLILVIKYFLLQRSLAETYTGGLGSFLTSVMVLAVIQSVIRESAGQGGLEDRYKIPTAQQAQIATEGVVEATDLSHHNLGYLLLRFFQLYGEELDTARASVSVDQGSTFARRVRTYSRFGDDSSQLQVLSPLEAGVDIGRSSYSYYRARQAFARSAKGIRKVISKGARGESLLKELIKEDEFLIKRSEAMRRRHEARASMARPIVIRDEEKDEPIEIDMTGSDAEKPVELDTEEAEEAEEAEEEVAEPTPERHGIKLKKPGLIHQILTRKTRTLAPQEEVDMKLAENPVYHGLM